MYYSFSSFQFHLNIKLNNLFRQGSGISVVLSSGNGTFTINNEKTIVAESSITENNINGKTFEKCTVDEERKFIEASDTKSSLDFTELLNSLNKAFDAMN